MNKEHVLKILQLTDKQLDWLEDDYLRIHKEYIQRVLSMRNGILKH